MPPPKRPRWLKIRMWLGQKIYKQYFSSRVLRIGFGQIIKLRCNPDEVEAMKYISQQTTIPLPKIAQIYKYEADDREDVVIKYVDGEPLEVAWNTMTQASKESICKELAAYIDQLRQLSPPKAGFVGSVSGGPGYDPRFGDDRFGPFNSIEEFHTYVLRRDPLDRWKEEKEVLQVHGNSNTYVAKFTHGDLSPGNVVVKNGKIAAIIDWETAGWFPEYWEYTKIRYQCWHPSWEDFYQKMDSTMKRYPTELAAEQAIWKRYEWYAYEVPRKGTG